MTTIISTNASDIIERPDGTAWPYAFVTPNGAAIFADTRTEIVEAIIDGYAAVPDAGESGDDARFDARTESLAILAASNQALVIAVLEEEGAITVAGLDEDVLTALFSEKDTVTLDFPEWNEEIPLILFATNYAPFSTVEPPRGSNIHWVNPHTEATYLESLQVLGVGELHVHADA